MKQHIKKWLEWRKVNTNGHWYQFLVLIGAIKSPSLIAHFKGKEIGEMIIKGLETSIDVGWSSLRTYLEKEIVRIEARERNKEIKCLFTLHDEIESHAIIKAFLLSDQEKEDLYDLMESMWCVVYKKDDEWIDSFRVLIDDFLRINKEDDNEAALD